MATHTLAIAVTTDNGRGNPSFTTAGAFAIGKSGSTLYEGFFRFTNVMIPPGATVTSAVLTLVASAGGGGGVATNMRMKVRANAADNATAPTDSTTFLAKTRTTAKGDWDPTSRAAGASNASTNLSAVIQEVINRGGWAMGNAILLLVDDDTAIGDGYVDVAGLDDPTYTEPRLVITFTQPEGSYSGAVIAGPDDGYSTPPSFNNSGDRFYVGDISSENYGSFCRFLGVDIPPGADILTAHLDLTSVALTGTVTDIHAKIKGNDADNATAPNSVGTFNSLVRTSAVVEWDPTAWVAGTTYALPDITAIIQEIVDRAGWVSGNALQIILEDDSSTSNNYVQVYSFEHATGKEPRLFITYDATPKGGAEAAINISASGAGIVYAQGGAEAGVGVEATGAGIEVHAGGAEAAIQVIADGDGIEIQYDEEGSEAVIVIITDGGGVNVLYAEEGSEAVINVGAIGGGAQIISGGAVATINVSAAGAGTQMGPAMIIEKGSWLSYRKLN